VSAARPAPALGAPRATASSGRRRRGKGRSRAFRHLTGYLACRAAVFGLALLPRRAGQAIGRALGHVFYLVSPRHRRIALDNLRLAFGDGLDDRQRRRIARRSFAHSGMIFLDAAYFPRLLRLPTERLAVYEGLEHLEDAARDGRGVLVFSGHFGHWELIALLQHRLGLPMAMVVRPLENRWLDRFLTRLRSLSGNTTIPKYNAARGVLRALRERRAVAILIDQNVRGAGGLFIDFFGRPASTTPGLATFALKSGAPIVPVFSYPLADGRVRIRYLPPMRPRREGRVGEGILEVTRVCTALLEEEVRRQPELWLWMHHRWRTRPAEPAACPPQAASSLAGRAGVGVEAGPRS
jgi:Kdo2-lipid IVA lauroyltransferase/acyltransferase